MAKQSTGEGYDVGYGKPPKASRFTKGRSGNPNGRPKGSGTRTSVERVLRTKVTATVDGRRRKVMLTEAVMMQLVQRALAGDVRAIRETMRIAEQISAARGLESAEQGPREIQISWISPGDPNPCLVPLDICAEVDGQIVLRQWAVDAAMARLPAGALKTSDLTLIRNSTEGTAMKLQVYPERDQPRKRPRSA